MGVLYFLCGGFLISRKLSEHPFYANSKVEKKWVSFILQKSRKNGCLLYSYCARNKQNWRSPNLRPKLQTDASLRSDGGWPNVSGMGGRILPESVAGC